MLIPSRSFSGRGAGSFGAFGGILEMNRLQPQVEELQGAILNVAGYLDNTATPLLVARHIAIEDTKQHFENEENPDGYGWYPLDPDYLASKTSAGYPSDILHREGDLESAATSEAAWVIADDTLAFDFGTLPEYGIYHQTGNDPNDSIGEHAEFRDRVRSRTSPGMGSAHDSLGIGRGNALPQREFIGLSEEAELQILEGFDVWFDAAESVYVRKSGVMQRRESSGRFGPKVL